MVALCLSIFCFIINLPLGYWRKRVRKFSFQWFAAIHAAVPIIIAIRVASGISYKFAPVFVALAVAGQLLGGKIKAPRRTPKNFG
jgi:hypothetical protein